MAAAEADSGDCARAVREGRRGGEERGAHFGDDVRQAVSRDSQERRRTLPNATKEGKAGASSAAPPKRRSEQPRPGEGERERPLNRGPRNWLIVAPVIALMRRRRRRRRHGIEDGRSTEDGGGGGEDDDDDVKRRSEGSEQNHLRRKMQWGRPGRPGRREPAMRNGLMPERDF